MRRQCFRMFCHFRIASGMAQNGNTSATKIMCQEIMKTLPEVYFATMLAGTLSKMHWQSFKMFSHLRLASGTAHGSRNHEIAGSVFCNNACRKLIQNASALFQNIFPLPDCVRHGPKWQYIGHKNNVSRNREMLAGKLSKMRRQCFRMFCHFRIASGTAQNGNTSAIKIMGQEIVKLLPEI